MENENKTENSTEVKQPQQVDVAQLKLQVDAKAIQLKAFYLVKKVRKVDWTIEFFSDASNLFSNYSNTVNSFCSKYGLDVKYIKLAEKEGQKAISMLLEGE